MRDTENSIKTLMDFGISRTQAKVYLTLAEKGTLTLRTASELSGVGRPDTYRTLLDLKKAGLIETIIDNPTRYRAIKISDAISILMGQKRKEIMSLKEKSGILLQQFEQKSTNLSAVSDTEFVVVPKGSTSIKKRILAIRNAEFSIDYITSFRRFNQTILVEGDDIIDAANRGVRIRFILEKSDKPLSRELEMFCKHSSCEIKFILKPPQALVAVFDKKETQIAISEEGDLTQTSMLWSNNPVLVKICQYYFEANWLEKSIEPDIFEEIKLF